MSWEDILKQPALTPQEEQEIQSMMRFRNMDRESAEKSVRRKYGKLGQVRQPVGRLTKEDILKRKPKSGPREAARKRMKAKGLRSFNKPQRLNDDSDKSHHVMASEGGKYKYIKYGQKGVKTNQTAGQRRAFKSRHAKNIKRGKMSAAYWADKVKWNRSKTKEKKNKKWRKGS